MRVMSRPQDQAPRRIPTVADEDDERW